MRVWIKKAVVALSVAATEIGGMVKEVPVIHLKSSLVQTINNRRK